MARVLNEVKAVAAERRKRVSTGQMNRFLEKIDFQRAPVPMAKRIRIFYMTQAAVARRCLFFLPTATSSCISALSASLKTRSARRLVSRGRRSGSKSAPAAPQEGVACADGKF